MVGGTLAMIYHDTCRRFSSAAGHAEEDIWRGGFFSVDKTLTLLSMPRGGLNNKEIYYQRAMCEIAIVSYSPMSRSGVVRICR